jgi:hypothetical protein
MNIRRLLPASFLGWVMLLAVVGIVCLLSVPLLFSLLVPTEWGGATE